jgi:excisionase family DNA binding protein
MMKPVEQPLLLTVAEVCETLRIGRSTLYRLISEGKIPVVHVGRAVRIRTDAVMEMIEELSADRGEAL